MNIKTTKKTYTYPQKMDFLYINCMIIINANDQYVMI